MITCPQGKMRFSSTQMPYNNPLRSEVANASQTAAPPLVVELDTNSRQKSSSAGITGRRMSGRKKAIGS